MVVNILKYVHYNGSNVDAIKIHRLNQTRNQRDKEKYPIDETASSETLGTFQLDVLHGVFYKETMQHIWLEIVYHVQTSMKNNQTNVSWDDQ